MQQDLADIPEPIQDPEPPTNLELVYGEAIDLIARVKSWDSSRFERYVHEWAYTLQTGGKYGKVVWAPGSGDKGRDVRAYVNDETGPWDNFQCKFYKDPIMPSEIWLELAKLCQYTFDGVFTVPRKYYFVAPKDVGPDVSNLIGNSDEIRKQLVTAWTKEGSSARRRRRRPANCLTDF